MRFTDGKEKLEIEIHEGQHSWDTTVEFFDHLTTPILNGTRQVGNVRTLLTNVYNRILGMSDYPAPEADMYVRIDSLHFPGVKPWVIVNQCESGNEMGEEFQSVKVFA